MTEQVEINKDFIAAGPVAGSFNQRGDFFQGRLDPVPMDEVASMHDRFMKRMEGIAREGMGDAADADPATLKACVDYCIALSRTREKPGAAMVAALVPEGAAAIREKTAGLLNELDVLDKKLKKALKTDNANGHGSPGFFDRIVHSFLGVFKAASSKKAEPSGNTRTYFKLSDASQSPVEPIIRAYLADKGFTITDYARGYAVDGRKNNWKIGKIVKEDKGLLDAYENDPYRAASNLMVVVTKNYYDLARASYGRSWQSCRANPGNAVRHGIAETDIGVMAAYLVRENDPDIHNPLGRINLKPYHKGSETVYLPFNPIGLHHPGFVAAVNDFADRTFNADKYGVFRLPEACESYQEFTTRTRLPDDAEAALKTLKVQYKKEGGRIIVDGNLSLQGLGLNRLPDFRDVVVTGGIDVSRNKLLSLEGLPASPIKWLNASSNLLVCFAGCTPDAGRFFNYQDCAYLLTTHGAPKAEEYRYGNKYDNYRQTETCVGPIEAPDRFPSFKR